MSRARSQAKALRARNDALKARDDVVESALGMLKVGRTVSDADVATWWNRPGSPSASSSRRWTTCVPWSLAGPAHMGSPDRS